MNLHLHGKNALVGGSSKGIGKAIALELALLGANVTLVSRSPEIMATIIPELPQASGQHHDFLAADFTDSHDLHRKVAALLSQKNIHILVNNTGGPAGGPILDAPLDAFEQTFKQHLLINQLLAQLTIPGMIQDGFGRIINIISTSVKTPLEGLGVSNTIRAAVANWAKTLASEVGRHGITVNNVLPGLTDTDRLREIIRHKAASTHTSPETVAQDMRMSVPAQRFGTPAEVAAAAAFLASPAAAYINGTNITVDGGRTKTL
jgi:3-oxoacyl-[acyl-carrier protein] reductase